MAKRHKWTEDSALRYIARNEKVNEGLTFWSAVDFLRNNHGWHIETIRGI